MIFMRCSHSPSIESAVARSASQTTFMGRLQNGACIKCMGEACSLTENMEKAFPFLNIDECVCFVGAGPVKKAFILKTPDLYRPVLPPDEIERHNRDVCQRFNMPAIVQVSTPKASIGNNTPPSSAVKDDTAIENALLMDMHVDMFKGVARRADTFHYKGTRLSRQDLDERLESMIRNSLCIRIELRCSRKGPATHFYVPSLAGYERIGNPPDMLVASAGSGIEEAFLLRFLPKHLRDTSGIIAIPHGRKNNKTVDLSLDIDGRSCAIEISVHTTPQHEALQAMKNLAAGFDMSIAVFIDARKYQLAKTVFVSEVGPRVDPRIVLAELWHVLKCPIRDICNCRGLVIPPAMLAPHERKDES